MSTSIPLPAAALLFCLLASGPAAGRSVESVPVPGRYLVVLEEDAIASAPFARSGEPAVRGLAREMSRLAGGRAGRTYEVATRAFELEAPEARVRALAGDPRVREIYEDAEVTPAMVQTPVPSWGLDRIDQRSPVLDSSYGIWSWGADVHLYVVDSGIRSTHAQFGGRVDVSESFSAVDDGLGAEDCLGHGTAVAGIAAGYDVGVAKGATLHSARIFDCSGRAMVSDVLAAIDWVTAEHRAPAVGLMALETPGHGLLDEAVRRSTEAGVLWVVAAGNSAADACDFSPARSPEALTVGALTAQDARAAFSNRGACVDLWAPGSGLTSVGATDDSGLAPFGGTSAAAPHVAGIAALWMEGNRRESPDVVSWMVTASATDLVDPSGVPLRLAYSALESGDLDLVPYATFSADCSARHCVFDGTASFDDDRIVDWSWSIGPEIAELSGPRERRVRLKRSEVPQGVDRITVRLTLTDSVGQTATLTRAVTLTETP